MSTSDPEPPIHPVGTQAFFPALLTHIRNLATSPAIPLDQVILQSILLCLIAGEKHLILRTPEEDVVLATKLAFWTLSCIFDIPTRKLRIRAPPGAVDPLISPASASTFSRPSKHKSPATDTGIFLRSLFLRSGSSKSNSNDTSQDEYDGESTLYHHRHYSHSTKTKRGSTNSQKTRGSMEHYPRSRSVPNNLVNIGQALASGIPRRMSPESILMSNNIAQQQQGEYNTTSSNTASPAPSPIIRPKPVYPALSSGLLPLPHSYTDPLTSSSQRPQSAHSRALYRRNSGVSSATGASSVASKPPELPRALVVSGLEDATEGIHRALARVLGEKQVVLERILGRRAGDEAEEGDDIWILPEGFLVVYVCPWSTSERPALHKSLLDKFAMSTNVFIPHNIRRDFYILPLITKYRPPAQQQQHIQQQSSGGNGSSNLPKLFFSHSNPGTPLPSPAQALPQIYAPTVASSTIPSVSVHRRASSQSSHGAKSSYTHHSHSHSHPNTQRHVPKADDPPAGYGFRSPPIPASFIQTLHAISAKQTYISPELTLYMADIFSATRHHPKLDGMLLGRAAMKDAEALVRASRVIGLDLTGMELLRPGPLAGSVSGGSAYEHGNRNGPQSLNEAVDDSSDDNAEDYSSALDVSVHNEPLLPILPPSVLESTLPPPIADVRTLDVSEVNIARIAPRVISHRVRLRASPEEEVLASALFGATFRPPEAKDTFGSDDANSQGNAQKETSVKEILVHILAEV